LKKENSIIIKKKKTKIFKNKLDKKEKKLYYNNKTKGKVKLYIIKNIIYPPKNIIYIIFFYTRFDPI